jgi:lipoprotein-releasing system permease protein
MDARVIVGAGLLRYNYEDPKTGKTKTMEMVRPGEDVRVSTVTAVTEGHPPQPVSFTATVVDVFKCGMSEYDSNLVFCNLEELQRVRGMIDPKNPADPDRKSITSIQIKLKNFADAPEVIERLQAVFPPGLFTIKTWEQKQGPLLAAVEIETGILNVLLFLIIAVAGFGILAIFFMIVVEKTRDIGILKALGASSSGVMSIFLSYGLALGVVGSGVGVALGLFFVRYINEIESAIAMVTGRKVFDDKVYYFPEIPTLVEPWMVTWVTIGAIAIAVLASVFPARRASRLRPVESLRYE